MQLNSTRLRLVPMILVMGAIFCLSNQSGDVIDFGQVPGLDKLAHLSIYGILAATVILAHSPYSKKESPLQLCWTTIVVCLLYGLSDELHQSFVPGRYVSGGDVMADVAGAMLVAVGWLMRKKRRGNEGEVSGVGQ